MTCLCMVLPKRAISLILATTIMLPSGLASPIDAQPVTSISIQVIAGQGAINNISRGTAFAPVVEVEDQSGKPVPDANVTFNLPSMGASATFPDGGKTLAVRTDATGRATARGLRPNNVVGQFEIRVSASKTGRTASTVITQTNAAPASTQRGNGKKWAIVLGIAGGAAVGAVAAMSGGSSNTPAGPGGPAADTPAGSVTPGTPGFGPPR
jgi:hypothetical protein